MCETCPFTCKGAEVCIPRQLKNQLALFLPNVVEEPFSKKPPTLTKPNILINVRINDREYYF